MIGFISRTTCWSRVLRCSQGRRFCSGKEEELSFAKAFAKFEDMELSKKEDPEKKDVKEEVVEKKEVSMFKMLRQSPLFQAGDPDGRLVKGKIFHVVSDDLYVDFGCKFHAIVRRPPVNGELYVKGAVVNLRLIDLELSNRFLGASKDLTLLEADAVLLGLVSSPTKSRGNYA